MNAASKPRRCEARQARIVERRALLPLDSHYPTYIPAELEAKFRENHPIRLPVERMRAA